MQDPGDDSVLNGREAAEMSKAPRKHNFAGWTLLHPFELVPRCDTIPAEYMACDALENRSTRVST